MSALVPSGAGWCAAYPTSRSLTDLREPFQSNVREFIGVCEAAGATVSIAATLRPPQRAYLMHFACAIVGYRNKATGQWTQIKPATAQDARAVTIGIDWTHGGDDAAALSAAQAMCAGYRIAYPAALDSRHIQGRAIDMSFSWVNTLWVPPKQGGQKIGLTTPSTGANPQLWAIGKTYGVIKLPSDPPHWSDDGH